MSASSSSRLLQVGLRRNETRPVKGRSQRCWFMRVLSSRLPLAVEREQLFTHLEQLVGDRLPRYVVLYPVAVDGLQDWDPGRVLQENVAHLRIVRLAQLRVEAKSSFVTEAVELSVAPVVLWSAGSE